jgi:hypothetical protein
MPAITVRCELDDFIKGNEVVRRGFVTLLDAHALRDYMGDFLSDDSRRVVLHISQSSGGNNPAADIASNLRSEDRLAMVNAAWSALRRHGQLTGRWVANQRARTVQPSSVHLGEPLQEKPENFAYLAGWTIEHPHLRLSDPDRLAEEIQWELNASRNPSESQWRCSTATPAELEAEPRLSILAGEIGFQRTVEPLSRRTEIAELNLILEGVPGTGKSHEIIRISKSGFAQPITTIVMHPAIGYEDMIEGVRPTAGGFESGANLHPKSGANWFYECYGEDPMRTQSGSEPPFGVRAGQFLLACARACKSPDDRFLVVLDEINRCNVPRAFGELLLSIEASKRWHWNEGTKKWEGDSPSVTLPYSGLQFFVPDNLYILGTMNTSDRSVAPLDQALRRRFAFHRLEPMPPADLKQALGDFGASALVGSAIDCWHALNKRLEAELGADMMLGHSYFFDAKRLKKHGGDEAEALRSTWRYSLLPQLFEILHIANRIELAQFDELTRHLGALGLEIESPRTTGMHAMLRVKERSGANGAT